MTVQDIIVCVLAFMPTGWGLLLVSEHVLFHVVYYGISTLIDRLTSELFSFVRLHKPVNRFFQLLSGDQSRRSPGVMKLLWACFYLPLLLSLLGFLLFPSSRLGCYSIKHSVEVCRFPVYLVGLRRTGHRRTKSRMFNLLLSTCDPYFSRSLAVARIFSTLLVFDCQYLRFEDR